MYAESHGRAVKHGWKERCGMRRGYLMSICRRMPITRQPYFLPTQITGCSLWLDGADSSSFTLSGSAVTQWNDKSGNGGNATQSTSGNRPTFTGSGAIFNAASNQHFNLNTTFSSTHSIFIVATPTSASQVYLFGRTYPSGHPTFIINYTGSSLEYYPGGDGSTRTTFASPTSTFIAGYVRNFGTSVFGRYNGNQVTISAAPTSEGSSLAWGSLGCSAPIYGNFYTGTIYEFMIFNTVLITTQCQTIESYLAQKWGLTGSLPAGHPGLNQIIHRNLQTTFTKTPYFVKFSPTQISGCSLWLDGADPAGNGVIPAIGASIATWADKSGQNQTITQSTTGNQALYTAGGGLTFTSGMQYPLNTSVFMNIFSIAYTIFVVEKRATSGLGFFIGNNAGGGGPLYLGYNANTAMRFTLAQVVDLDYTVPAYSGSDATEPTRIWACRWFGSAANLRDIGLNGQITPLSQAFNLAPSFSGNQTIGGCVYGNYVGKMYEMIIFNRAISNSEKQQVESYLAQKWRLSLVLPAAHLNTTFPAGAPTAIQPYVPSIRPALVFAAVPTYILKYTYTGSNQSFVVPSGVTSVTVYMWGAGGGAGLGGNGGAGCYVQGVLTVVPGETLTIVVGQGGGNKARALGKSYGGGGAGGGPDGGRSDIPSSQGGGRSAIVRSSTDLVTAGAGGGGRGGRGGRGRLVTGENGTGQATGGTQSAGGTNNGGLYTGGDANQDNSAAGGSGYYGGGGGGQDQAGGGGSCLTSNLSLIVGQSTFGTESSDGSAAPQTSSPYYNSDVGFGATSAYGYNYGSGGNGLVVIGISSKTAIASVSYSRLILSAWFGSVAYRYGLDVTTVVNNAFGGNPSNTITLNVATLTNPQIGTTKYTYIVYMFNGIQKFSSPYAEGTVLTFSSLT